MHTKRKQNLTRMLMQSLPMLKSGLTNHQVSFESCAVSHPVENHLPRARNPGTVSSLVQSLVGCVQEQTQPLGKVQCIIWTWMEKVTNP